MYGTNFFLIPLYTRVLSPSDYGILDMIRIFESMALLVVAFEINQGLGRYYMDEVNSLKKQSYFSTALIFTTVCFGIFFLLSMLFSKGLSNLFLGQKGLVTQFQLGILFISLNGILLLIYCQFRYDLRSKDYTTISIVTFFATSIFSVILAYFLKWGLDGILIATCFGNLVGLTSVLIKYSSRIKFEFDISKLKKMLRFSLPLVPSGMAVFIHGYIDRMMINHYLTLNEVGLYGMGFRIAAITSIILAGFNRSLSPLIISNYRNPNTPSQIAKIFRYFIGISLLFFMFLSLFAKEILILLTTPKFYESSFIVIYLVPAILFSQMYMFAPGTGIAKKTHLIMIISISGAVINVILNFIFIPHFGYEGAAFATLIANFILFTIKMSVSQKFYRIPFEWIRISIPCIITVIIIIIVLKLEYGIFYNLIIKAFVLVMLPIILVLTGIVPKNELKESIQKLFQNYKLNK